MRFTYFIHTVGFVFFIAILFCSCRFLPKNVPAFTLVPGERSGLRFQNIITESDSFNTMTFDYIYNGGGVAIGDVNNDGLSDLYFTGNQISSRLYLNRGNLTFEDITALSRTGTSQWCTGVSMVDINTDGLLDIYVCTANPDKSKKSANLFFINQGVKNGIPVFKDEAGAYGLADSSYCTQAAWLDYDQDGDLDMYLLNNALEEFNRNNVRPERNRADAKSFDRLYRNNGNRTFSDVSFESGIIFEGWGLGVAITDINHDNFPDVYVANDFMSNDLFYVNDGGARFTNKIDKFLSHQSHNSMGVDVADFNNDSRSDIAVVDMMPEENARIKTMFGGHSYDKFMSSLRAGYQPQFVRNMLHMNRGTDSSGNVRFSEIGQLANVAATDWSWSPLFFDFDNDGLKDLFVSNGYGKDVTDLDFVKFRAESSMFGDPAKIRERIQKLYLELEDNKKANYFFRNRGDLRFESSAKQWGLVAPSLSNGAAYGDLDRDGDLDLVVNNINEEVYLYENTSSAGRKNNYLRIRLNGAKDNPRAIGAKVWAVTAGERQFFEQYPVRGYKSQSEEVIHLGLRHYTTVDSLIIQWPSGDVSVMTGLPGGTELTMSYDSLMKFPGKRTAAAEQIFTEVSDSLGITLQHKENYYIDFKVQPTLLRQLSRQGPAIAVGDVNGDKLDDFYVGAARGSEGVFMIQTASGKFERRNLQGSVMEQCGALLFDADGDDDLDLYVVSGGSEETSISNLQDQLYLNDGTGSFSETSAALPRESESGSVVTAADFDRDGDLDLFIGGRVSPGNYPLSPGSRILKNQKGRFVDATTSVCPDLQHAGLVTASVWSDFNNDGWVDLVITAEWAPVRFYQNRSGVLHDITDNTGISDEKGWWYSINAADFDLDGDTDYVAGNYGINSKFQTKPDEPLELVVKDFDSNGKIDPVFSYFLDGKRYPVHTRDDLIELGPFFRRRLLSYGAYGSMTFDKLFAASELEGAETFSAGQLHSSWIENLGDGKFRLHTLPVEVQFSPLMGTVVTDINDDGYPDIICSGNSFAEEIWGGYADAGLGLTLLNDKGKAFIVVDHAESGLTLGDDQRALALLYTPALGELIITTASDGPVRAFCSKARDKKMLLVNTLDAEVRVQLKNGTELRREAYYGAGYLSQSSRCLTIDDNVVSVTSLSFTGTRRILFSGNKLHANK